MTENPLSPDRRPCGAETRTGSAVPGAASSTFDRIVAHLDAAGLAGEADWLRGRVQAAGAAWRLADRDEVLRDLASLLGDFGSGREMARTVHAALLCYTTRGGWRFERGGPPPTEPLRAAMHRVLTLGDGGFPTTRQLRRIFAGVGHGNGPGSVA